MPAPLVAQVAFYPASDSLGTYESGELFSSGYALDASDMSWFREAYHQPADHWRAAPLHADLVGLPPTLIATAELDPLRDQGRAFAAKLVRSGVATTYREVSGMIHGFANYRQVIPSAHEDFVQLLALAMQMIDQARARP